VGGGGGGGGWFKGFRGYDIKMKGRGEQGAGQSIEAECLPTHLASKSAWRLSCSCVVA